MAGWLLFLEAFAAVVVALYVPGYLFCRGLRFSRTISAIAAPVASTAGIAVLAIVYGKAGIACSGPRVLLPIFLIGLAAFLVSRPFTRAPILALPKHADIVVRGRRIPFDAAMLASYVLFGLIVCWYLYVSCLGAPDAFYCRWDNFTHLNDLRAFFDSGVWSSLQTNKYATAPTNAIPFKDTGGGFYPAAWHDIVAAVSGTLAIDFLIVANALNAVIVGIIFPASSFLLMKTLFPKSRRAIAAGSIITMSFSAFPWAYFLYGPYVANLLGQSMLPASLGIFMLFLDNGFARSPRPDGAGSAEQAEQLARETDPCTTPGRETDPYATPGLLQKLLSFCIYGIVAFIGLALSHPNTVFTAFLFLAAYGCHYINGRVKSSPRIDDSHRKRTQVLAVGGFIACVAAVWLVCMNLPFLHSVVYFRRSINATIPRALYTIAALSLSISSKPSLFLAFVSLVGFIICVRRDRWWILAPCIVMALAYYEIRAADNILKNVFGGFWYVDIRRVGANLSMFLIPVASIGLSECAAYVERVVRRRRRKGAAAEAAAAATGASAATGAATEAAASAATGVAAEPAAADAIAGPSRAGASGRKSAQSLHPTFLVVLALFAVLNFVPRYPFPNAAGSVETGIGNIRHKVYAIYDRSVEQIYSLEEREFVDRVVDILPDNALVINMPHDGSVWAYGTNGLNTYYRSASSATTKVGKTIREHLVDYATDEAVADAVEYTGATYVLQLDQGATQDNRPWLVQYVVEQYHTGPKYWAGINAIRDDTPGFELVLSEGDMRLYRIESREEVAGAQ